MPDDESSYFFDLSKLHKLSEFHTTLHAIRLPFVPFVKMLSSVADAGSQLHNLTLSLFTWRVWNFSGPDTRRWAMVDMALLELSRVVEERCGVDLAIRVIVKLLECGPHDIRDILPLSGDKGLVRFIREDDFAPKLFLL